MTIATTTNKIQYNCDGATKDFAFTFPITTESDLVVTLVDVNGVETILTEITDYTVSLGPWTSGGTVTTVAEDAYASPNVFLIKRVMTLTQSTDYVSNDPFPAETHEAALDRLVMIDQQLDEENDRAIKLPQTTALTECFVEEPQAGYVLAWNDTEDGLQNIAVSSLGALVITTPFTESLLDESTADNFWAAFLAGTPTLATMRSDLAVPGDADNNTYTGTNTFSAAVTTSSTLTANGAATFNSTIDVSDILQVNGTALKDGALVAGGVNSGAAVAWAPSGYLHGLITSNGTDTNNDIDIAVGECADSTGVYILKLTSGLTKQLDATWAVGTNQGGLFSGSKASSTWYYVFIIRKDSDGTLDAGFDTSKTAANIPTGYTAYRRIGAVLTNGSSNIYQFYQYGDVFWWDVAFDDYSGDPGTGGTNVTVTAPPIYGDVFAHCLLTGYATANAWFTIQPTDLTVTASTITNADAVAISGSTRGENNKYVAVNASGQIKAIRSNAASTAYIKTSGYRDNRGRIYA